MKKIRVMILFSSSNLGGAERSLSRMSFYESDISYTLATLGSEGPWSEWIRTCGKEPIALGAKGKPFIFSFVKLINFLKTNPVDVLYVCGLRASFVTRFYKLIFPKMKVVHAVRWNPNSNLLLDRLFVVVERFFYLFIDAWVTNSEAAKNTLINRCNIPKSNIFNIYNGIEISVNESDLALKKEKIVLTVANLNPRKGYLEYLETIRAVIKMDSEIRFVFVGRDDMNGLVQKKIIDMGLAENVHYAGFQSDVSCWFSKSKVFVLPSLWGEGCPTAILEAFSFGLPVMAHHIDGIPELVEDRIDGLLFKPNDPELAKNLFWLVNAAESRSMGLVGRKKVLEKFTLEVCSKNHASFFNRLVRN